MKFAYADPPYLGMGKAYLKYHPDSLIWDNPETHRTLIARLVDEYPDGWAMSLSTPSLRNILPMCPDNCRTMSWVKPFCSFKQGVKVAYTWEPVIFSGGRKRKRADETIKDHCIASMSQRKGFFGAKPELFCFWVFDALNIRQGDEFHDLFPGSGAVTNSFNRWISQKRLPLSASSKPRKVHAKMGLFPEAQI